MFYLVLSLVINPVITSWIDRSHNGDRFDAGSGHCDRYHSQCIQNIYNNRNFWWFHRNKCSECQCYEECTFYEDYCHQDLSREKLGCEFFIKGTQYYGMGTYILENYNKEIGIIMRKDSWQERLYVDCLLHEESKYWHSKDGWKYLFTEGRNKNDFYLYQTESGVILKFLGNDDNYKLYLGLLMNLKLTCNDWSRTAMTSCLTLKAAGKRDYNSNEESSAKPPTTFPSIVDVTEKVTHKIQTTSTSKRPSTTQITTTKTTKQTTRKETSKSTIKHSTQQQHFTQKSFSTTPTETTKKRSTPLFRTQTTETTKKASTPLFRTQTTETTKKRSTPLFRTQTTKTKTFSQPAALKNDGQFNFFTNQNILSIFIIVLLLLCLIGMMIYCHLKRRHNKGPSPKSGLLLGHRNVCYNSSGEYTASEFQQVHQSTYSDEKELQMRSINSFNTKGKRGPSGILYINGFSDSGSSASSSINSEVSEDPLVTEKVLRKIENDRRTKWLQKGV